MGLMFLFPSEEGESNHIIVERENEKKKKVVLISYGLPGIFWAYAASIWIAVFFLSLAIYDSLLKLASSPELIDKLIVSSLTLLLVLLPLSILGILLYEKRIIKTPDLLEVQHRPFLLGLIKRKYSLKENQNTLHVEHFLESANVAKIQNREDMKAFQNKGHYQLVLNQEGRKIIIDRHSSKNELSKIKDILDF